MKIAMDWVAEYVSPVPTAAVAGEALMNAGLPVESVVEAEGGVTQVLDVEVTSNRTDCFSHVGLARELSALTCANFAMPKVAITESGVPAGESTTVQVGDAVACPYYSARLIRHVKVGPSPAWLVRRLAAIGLRSINNVVDVTNYVLMELGQPLHAFDFDRLAEGRIVVRHARKGEKMLAIDGKEYALEPSMLVIADGQKAAAIAGVMGGKETEVTEGTTTVLLESARFEPLTIRTTSRALGLKSDSSYRFERGIDPTMAELASKRAAQLIVEVAGGEIAPGVVTVGTAAAKQLQVGMRLKRYEQIMGIPVSAERAVSILSSLGFSPWIDDRAGEAEDAVYTRIPAHRLDVDREIDLIEEVARVQGLGHVPTLDRVTHAVRPEPVGEKALRTVMNAMVEAGFSEAVTVTFIPEGEAAAFAGEFNGTAIRTQHGGWRGDVLRPSLLPSLLAARRTNQYGGMADAHLFEKGAIFLQQGEATEKRPLERRMLSAVASDVGELAATVRLVATRLNGAAEVSVVPTDFPFYQRGTSGEVRLTYPGGSMGIGNIGVFTAELQKQYDLRERVAGMELELESLIRSFEPVRRARAVPRYPGVKRDLSVVVEEGVRWADVEGMIRGAKLAHLEEVGFVTTFRNKAVGEGKKSLTLTLEFREAGRTLTSGEVDEQVATAVKVLGEGVGAVLRA